MLEHNTLLSVITFVDDLFYPQSSPPTLAIILKKGVPHPTGQNTLWVKIRSDGHRKVKGKRLRDPDARDELAEVKNLVRTFIANPSTKVENVPEFQIASPLDIHDPNFEVIPEAYLDDKPPEIDEMQYGIEMAVRDTVAYLIKAGKEKVILDDWQPAPQRRSKQEVLQLSFGKVALSSIFNLKSGEYHSVGMLQKGEIPLVSCGETDNGVIGDYSVPSDKIHEDALTIAYNGSWPLLTKFHPYRFGAKDDVAVCIPKRPLRPTTLLFLRYMISRQTWRYSYGRKCYRTKLENLRISVPLTTKGEIDEDSFESMVSRTDYWGFLAKQLDSEGDLTRTWSASRAKGQTISSDASKPAS